MSKEKKAALILNSGDESLICDLTEEEVAQHAKDAAMKSWTLAGLHVQKKSYADDFKAKIDGKDLEIRNHLKRVRTGIESRQVPVETLLEKGEAVSYRLDTGVEIRRRLARQDELQQPMDLDDMRLPKERTSAEQDNVEPVGS